MLCLLGVDATNLVNSTTFSIYVQWVLNLVGGQTNGVSEKQTNVTGTSFFVTRIY